MAVWVHQFRLLEIGWVWWAWIACFVLDDLAYYVFHRAAHRVRWFWASHVIHHSSQHYNLSTALRQTWTGFFSLAFLFRLPLFLIGFPPAMVFFCAGINLIYQFWIHTEVIGRMPALVRGGDEHAVAPPRPPRRQSALSRPQLCRRLHHLGPDVRQLRARARRRPAALRHRPPARLLQCALGGVPRMDRHRPRRVAAPGWRHKPAYLLREPGWSHDGSRETSDTIRDAWRASESVAVEFEERRPIAVQRDPAAA